ncbi:MAG: EamA family transporter [Pseudooceanicola sp.]|nr:EamA family transporter [Pseudooceanicola sp.]
MPQPASTRPMTTTEWALLLTLSLLWGGSFFFNDIALRSVPVFTVVTARVVIAAILLTALLRARGTPLPHDRHIWLAFMGMGLLNNAVPFTLIVWGQQHIASGLASILNAATPLFTVVLAHVLTADERMTRGRLAGVLIGFAGVALMIGPAALNDMGTSVAAQAMCLAAALSYGFAGIFGRRFRAMGVAPMTTATGQVIASSCVMLPFALIIDRPWTLPAPDTVSIAALICVAALSTALAYVIYFRILATAGATNLVLVTFLIPVSAIVLGTVFLGESLLPRHLAGMALIGAGLAAIDGRIATRISRS